MLQEEFTRLAKSVDYISEDQAKRIIGIMLDRLKDDANASIIDVYVYATCQNNNIILPYMRRSNPGIPAPQFITLNDSATGLLVWVAENLQPIWLDDIDSKSKSGTNRLTNQVIEGRYFNLYDRTRAFAAVPIEYRGQFRAILTID